MGIRHYLSGLSIRTQFLLVLASVGCGLLLYAGVGWRQQEMLRVGGPAYQNIVRGKDMVADILPPPRYIIESYLVVLQAQQSHDSSGVQALAKRLDELARDFDQRGSYWSGQPLSPPSRQLLLQDADAPARQFFALAREKFFPQKLAGQDTSATLQQLAALYQQHRLQIDKLVERENAALATEEQAAETAVAQSRIIILCSLAAILLLALWLVLTISRAQRQQLALLQQALQQVALGNLQHPIGSEQGNELGQLSNASESMRQNLQQRITRVRDAAHHLKHSSDSIHAEAQLVHSVARTQQDGIAGMGQQVAGLTGMLAQLASDSATAAASSGEATSAAQQSGQELQLSGEVLQQVVDTVRITASLLEELSTRAEEIGGVTGTIRDIAEQTNLLALNAAIEAARAGESGRGFAVVADEVRKLAERTSQATGNIGGILGSVQQSTREAAGSIRQGLQQSEAGLGKVRDASRTMEQLRGNIDRLGAALNHVVSQLQASGSLREDVYRELQSVLAQSRQQSAAIDKLHEMIKETRQAADSLETSSARFKL
ncbi:methyl-accepting chemotaxis protein [Vogesella sp. LIG4]|uniref:methyl-accepting chemotaxis protein n=1 Tax=Vogesella sp. LIG4 TaxID=1192162 RepID=UPI000820084D|nr:methyl-accepting chemotaxis protein [Vogesella sp. LIG4]SCK07021.1 methyl-accepting chemotaxis protein [Vogesella sp. LIG4]